MTEEFTVLQAGSVFHGRYEVSRCIRRGGMGAVYEVRDLHTTRRRALKVMLPKSVSDPDLRARFQQETTITAEVRSDHTVEIFDAGIDELTSSPFLVMELLEGEDLSTVLERGPLDVEDASRILHQLARVLDKTHAAGIVHRDLKPENLFLTRTDEAEPRLKVLDFGVAKLVAPEGTAKTTRVLGTPLYMSKEQILGDGSVGPPADLYAMAHIAYAMLTGRPYWLDEASSSPAPFIFMSKVLAGAPEPASARAQRHGVMLSSEIDDWFARATDLDPMQRFQRASELIAEFEAILGVTPRGPVRSSFSAAVARPSTTAPNTLAPRATKGRSIPTLGIAALSAVGLVVALIASRGEERASADALPRPSTAVDAIASASSLAGGDLSAAPPLVSAAGTPDAAFAPPGASSAIAAPSGSARLSQASAQPIVRAVRAARSSATAPEAPPAPPVAEAPDPTKVR